MRNNKGFILIEMVVVLFIIFALVGEIMCIVKCINSDWKPSYKREIIYGVSAITGFGMIVGYISIPDEKEDSQ